MVAKGSRKWIMLSFTPSLIGFLYSHQLGLLFLALPIFTAFFFRDPERIPDGSGVVSPADGFVRFLEEENGRVRVGVFMNLHNVHVNRSPLKGKVLNVEHIKGSHLPAFTKASEKNERMITDIETEEGDMQVIQIAGTVIRRITCYVKKGDEVERGERIGVIAFSSRVDVLLPDSFTLENVVVSKGEKVKGGETIIAKKDDE